MILNLEYQCLGHVWFWPLARTALGGRPQRSSSSMGLGLSVIIVFVYYVIMSFTSSLGEAAYIPPFIAYG